MNQSRWKLVMCIIAAIISAHETTMVFLSRIRAEHRHQPLPSSWPWHGVPSWILQHSNGSRKDATMMMRIEASVGSIQLLYKYQCRRSLVLLQEMKVLTTPYWRPSCSCPSCICWETSNSKIGDAMIVNENQMLSWNSLCHCRWMVLKVTDKLDCWIKVRDWGRSL